MAASAPPRTILAYVGLDLMGDALMKMPFVRALREIGLIAAMQGSPHKARAYLDESLSVAERQGARVGLVRVLHAEGERAGGGTVLRGEIGRRAARLAVDDEVDAALAVQQHVLAAVLGDEGEAHRLEQGLEGVGGGRGELDEFEPHQAHGDR